MVRYQVTRVHIDQKQADDWTDEWERKPYDLRQVLRPAVALRDRRVLVAEQSCNGAANDVAATNDDGICAGNGYTGGLE